MCVCVCSGSRGSACCPCWLRTAPVICSNSTAFPGCAPCSRSYRYDAHTTPTHLAYVVLSIKPEPLCGCPPAVPGSGSDHPASGEHSEGLAAVLVPASRAGQGGRPQLNSGHPYISAGP